MVLVCESINVLIYVSLIKIEAYPASYFVNKLLEAIHIKVFGAVLPRNRAALFSFHKLQEHPTHLEQKAAHMSSIFLFFFEYDLAHVPDDWTDYS